MIYKVTNIRYDTDGQKVELPRTLDIEIPDDMSSDEIEDFLSDEISNLTGYCHFGFSFNLIQ